MAIEIECADISENTILIFTQLERSKGTGRLGPEISLIRYFLQYPQRRAKRPVTPARDMLG
jgi:hypothetical protein